MDRKTFSIGAGAFVGAFVGVLALGSMHGCGNGAELLATVNGRPLRMSDFSVYLANKPRVQVVTSAGKQTAQVSGTLGGQAAVDMIREEVELQLAREKGLYPTDAEVQQEVEFRKREDPNFLLELESQGVTLDVIRKGLLVSLAEEKLVTQGVTVTSAQAKAYIQSHKNLFVTAPRVKLGFLFVRDQASKKPVDEAIGSGQSFMDVALRYSEAPNASDYSGYLTDPGLEPPAVSALPSAVQAAVQHLDLYGVSGWIPYGGGFGRFYLAKRWAAEPIKIDDDRIENVRRLLAKQEGGQVNNMDAMVRQKLASSNVRILQEQYKNVLTDNSDSP